MGNIKCCQNPSSVNDLTISKEKCDNYNNSMPYINNRIGQSNNKNNEIMLQMLSMLNLGSSIDKRNEDIANYLNNVKSEYPSIIMTIASSTLNFDSKNYIIHPSGLLNSERKSKDGIVLFGTKNSRYVVNDFTFPIEATDTKDLDEFPNFAIYFNINEQCYYIKDFNTGLGALMKISSFVLNDNSLINVGSNYLILSYEEPILTVKIVNSSILQDNMDGLINDKFQTLEFRFGDSDQTLYIGRSQKCDIAIEDMMLSKVQSRIQYIASKKELTLLDGDGNKESTNGTWVYILSPAKIYNNFIFKAEHTLFHLVYTNKLPNSD